MRDGRWPLTRPCNERSHMIYLKQYCFGSRMCPTSFGILFTRERSIRGFYYFSEISIRGRAAGSRSGGGVMILCKEMQLRCQGSPHQHREIYRRSLSQHFILRTSFHSCVVTLPLLVTGTLVLAAGVSVCLSGGLLGCKL